MAYFYRRKCKGCRRPALCHAAPRTPPEEAEDNLFCDDCHEAGLAVYTPIPDGLSNSILGSVLFCIALLGCAVIVLTFVLW